ITFIEKLWDSSELVEADHPKPKVVVLAVFKSGSIASRRSVRGTAHHNLAVREDIAFDKFVKGNTLSVRLPRSLDSGSGNDVGVPASHRAYIRMLIQVPHLFLDTCGKGNIA